ncbi:ribonuclease HI family protein [Massilia phosphatilytica]
MTARPAPGAGWFDGSAKPNPGRCGIGARLDGPGGIRIEIARPAGHGDSSEAEYRALIVLLEVAVAHGAHDLTIHGDSRVVVDDVAGPDLYAAPALAPYRRRVHALLAALSDVRLRWVPRRQEHRCGRAVAARARRLFLRRIRCRRRTTNALLNSPPGRRAWRHWPRPRWPNRDPTAPTT